MIWCSTRRRLIGSGVCPADRSPSSASPVVQGGSGGALPGWSPAVRLSGRLRSSWATRGDCGGCGCWGISFGGDKQPSGNAR